MARLVRLLLSFLCLLLASPVPCVYAHGAGTLPENINYTAIGDSVSAGWGSPMLNGGRVNGYVSQLHRQLLIRGTSELHNLGIPGLTSGQFLFMLDHWPEYADQLKKADLITLSIGGNDIIWTDHQSPGDVVKMREAMEKYAENIQTILEKIRALNPRAKLYVLEVYNPFPENDGRHAPLNEWVVSVNESIATAANAHGAYIVPTASLFLKHEKEYVNLANNDIHPNTAGHMRIAEQIAHSLFGKFIPLLVEEKMQPMLLWDGKPRKLESALFFENETVYIEANQLQKLYADSTLQQLRYRIGSWSMRVNGKRIKLDSPILTKDGLLYVPLRAVSEALGAKVYWVEDSRTINVVLKKVSIQ